MQKAETFLYALSFLMPIAEDETLTAYKAYAKALEVELEESRNEIRKLKDFINHSKI
jgi:hypothetical protein